MVHVMNRTNRFNESVAQIIRAVEEISFQTSVFALDAAIRNSATSSRPEEEAATLIQTRPGPPAQEREL
jgi:hypothetical protein